MAAGSGIVASQTLTPDTAGILVVTITYDSQGRSGSDWGAAFTTKPYCTQSGTTVYGNAVPMSTTRGVGVVKGIFTVTAGGACEVGIYGTISGAVAADWYNVHVTAELIKR
jgi:hypothetical protein